jgi:hypothetical protein
VKKRRDSNEGKKSYADPCGHPRRI